MVSLVMVRIFQTSFFHVQNASPCYSYINDRLRCDCSLACRLQMRFQGAQYEPGKSRRQYHSIGWFPVLSFACGVVMFGLGCTLIFWADLDRVQERQESQAEAAIRQWNSEHREAWLHSRARVLSFGKDVVCQNL
jgi:hypothetical protein